MCDSKDKGTPEHHLDTGWCHRCDDVVDMIIPGRRECLIVEEIDSLKQKILKEKSRGDQRKFIFWRARIDEVSIQEWSNRVVVLEEELGQPKPPQKCLTCGSSNVKTIRFHKDGLKPIGIKHSCGGELLAGIERQTISTPSLGSNFDPDLQVVYYNYEEGITQKETMTYSQYKSKFPDQVAKENEAISRAFAQAFPQKKGAELRQATADLRRLMKEANKRQR